MWRMSKQPMTSCRLFGARSNFWSRREGDFGKGERREHLRDLNLLSLRGLLTCKSQGSESESVVRQNAKSWNCWIPKVSSLMDGGREREKEHCEHGTNRPRLTIFHANRLGRTEKTVLWVELSRHFRNTWIFGAWMFTVIIFFKLNKSSIITDIYCVWITIIGDWIQKHNTTDDTKLTDI